MSPVLLLSPNTNRTSYVTEGLSSGQREQLTVLAPAASAACCCVHSLLLMVSIENVTLLLAAPTYTLPHAAVEACRHMQQAHEFEERKQMRQQASLTQEQHSRLRQPQLQS